MTDFKFKKIIIRAKRKASSSAPWGGSFDWRTRKWRFLRRSAAVVCPLKWRVSVRGGSLGGTFDGINQSHWQLHQYTFRQVHGAELSCSVTLGKSTMCCVRIAPGRGAAQHSQQWSPSSFGGLWREKKVQFSKERKWNNETTLKKSQSTSNHLNVMRGQIWNTCWSAGKANLECESFYTLNYHREHYGDSKYSHFL